VTFAAKGAPGWGLTCLRLLCADHVNNVEEAEYMCARCSPIVLCQTEEVGDIGVDWHDSIISPARQRTSC